MVEIDSKATPLTYIIKGLPSSVKGERIDKALTRLEGLPSRSQLKAWIDEGRVLRNKKVLDASDKVFNGDEIQVSAPKVKTLDLKPINMNLRIFFEDEDLLVVYKPRGLAMHPGAGKKDTPTLVHALLGIAKSLSSIGGVVRPGIVHRLDKNTEGIVVVAKNDFTHENLSRQFAERSVDRAYWALVYGLFPKQMIIDAPIGRHHVNRKKMAVTTKGRPSLTTATLLQHFSGGYSWVQCKLGTGRTHQIRVHLSHKKFPVVGDSEYSRKKQLALETEKQDVLDQLKGQALVAFRLGFTHPRSGEKIFFESEMPEWLKVLTNT